MSEGGHIVAIGGAGFTEAPSNFAIDTYILSLARCNWPRVGFIPTATGDDSTYVSMFLAAYSGLDCRPSYLPLFSNTPDLTDWVFKQDVIFVGGGNTLSMLAVWRAWGLDKLLDEALARGAVLAGQSAGAICWFEQGVTDSWAGPLRVMDCLGFLSGSCCPHYCAEPERKPAYHAFVSSGEINAGFAIDDGAALHFTGGELSQVVSWRDGASAYYVSRNGDSQAYEKSIEPLKLEPVVPDWPVR